MHTVCALKHWTHCQLYNAQVTQTPFKLVVSGLMCCSGHGQAKLSSSTDFAFVAKTLILTGANASLAFSIPAVPPQQVQSHCSGVNKADLLISWVHVSDLDRSGYSLATSQVG